MSMPDAPENSKLSLAGRGRDFHHRRMKRALFLLLFLAIPCLADMESDLAEIRAEFEKAEVEKLAVESFTHEFDSGPGQWNLKLHRAKDGTLHRVSLETGGEHGWSQETYYFKDGQIFFALLTMADIPVQGPELTREIRLYVKDGEVIRALKKTFQGETEAQLNAARAKSANKPLELTEEQGGRLILRAHALAGLTKGTLRRLEDIAVAGYWYFPYE